MLLLVFGHLPEKRKGSNAQGTPSSLDERPTKKVQETGSTTKSMKKKEKVFVDLTTMFVGKSELCNQLSTGIERENCFQLGDECHVFLKTTDVETSSSIKAMKKPKWFGEISKWASCLHSTSTIPNKILVKGEAIKFGFHLGFIFLPMNLGLSQGAIVTPAWNH